MAVHIDFDACETRVAELKKELVKYLSSYEQIKSIMNDFNAAFHDDIVERVMERLACIEKENTKFENAVNCFIHDVEYAMNQLKISDGPGTTKNEIFG